MRLKSLLIVFFFSLMSGVNAAHIVGGDIFYNYLGGNNYEFHVRLYRDCLSTGAQYDNPMYLTVYRTTTNTEVNTFNVTFPGSQVLPVVFNNPCVTPPNNICTEVAEYVIVVNLPPINGGYTISYQRCCRGANVTNLINPDDTGLTLSCQIPGQETGAWENNSARFINYPPLLLCNNDDLIFNHAALDPDGDQLVYSLVTPNAGASPLNPQPNTAPPPPYPLVNWQNGFNAAQPLGPGSSINIDPVTGLLTASPDLLGLFVVGIQVQEIRNGVVLNTTIRDFLFRVFNCDIEMQAILPTQEELSTFVSYCNGLDIQFENNSFGGSSYSWDFGVPGITTDVSTAFEPSYTYPSPGTYTATLIVNPGWNCTDTAYIDIIVNNEFEVSWTSQDSLCIIDNSFDFVGASNGPAGGNVVYEWDFGPNANTPTAAGITANGIVFDTPGTHQVTLTGSYSVCEAEFTEEIYVMPGPEAEMVLPNQIECEGLTISFGNNTTNASNYAWDFGDGFGTSTDEAPTYTFSGPGTYTVSLEAWSTPACIDIVEVTFTLNEPLILSFVSDTAQCITDNSFDFDGTVWGPPSATYTWDFGPSATPSSSTDTDVFGVVFSETGFNTVTLTGTFDECVETVSQEIYLFTSPTINFGIEPGLQCAPFLAEFIDYSWAETPITYNWNFGDGNASTEQNPTHLFPNPGNYPITLTIITTEGCADTLTMLQSDLVNVRPSPVAGFTVTPDYTDICNSEVQMIDASQGAQTYFYFFDDSTSFYNGDNPNPYHTYLYDGSHYPYQIVTNEWGCKDTATSELYIEPFTMYIPNTFTPDGDEFNNTLEAISDFYIAEWHMTIYNRWGQVVFETYDPHEGWDGTFNGKYVQDGTYGYTIEYKTCEPLNPDKFITGHVNMLR